MKGCCVLLFAIILAVYRNAIVSASIAMFCILFMCVYATAAEMSILRAREIGDRKISGAVSLGTFHFSEWESVDNSLAPDPVHKTLYDGSCFTVTYSDGSVVSYDLSYRPLFINGTLAKAGVKNTLVPLRFVAESLGGRVDWEASERRITLSIDTARARETVQMTIGSNCMYVSAMGWGTRELVNNFAPEIIDGRAYVPVYFLTERFAVPLTWESSGSSKLMVLAPGNIYIDFIEYNDNAIGMDDALQLLKETQTANFDMFQKERGPSNDSAQETVYKQIRQNITDTQLIGEITRYYIFESCGGTFYMDKITGDVFYQQREDLLVYSVVIYVPGIFTPFIHYFS